jgi:DNA-binding LacI/PurR family transcriptional regulator
MPHVTVVDVARLAGVSKSTVSNVIRGNAVVAPETKAKVEAAVRTLGYRPNGVARALRERTTRVLALVVPDPVNPFYAELAHGMERRARRDGYGVLVTNTGCDPATELSQVTALMSRRPDGVLVGALSPRSRLHLRLLDEGLPVVCAFAADDQRLGILDADDATGMAAIVEHLARLGHRRVAYAGQSFDEAGADLRRLAFLAAAGASGMTEVGLEDGPTAVVAHNDTVAITQLDLLHGKGLRVPDDVSVTGYDDIALAAHGLIRLTTVGTDAEHAGEVAAEQLIAAVREHRHVGHRHVQRVRLVVRGTTGPASRGAARTRGRRQRG